MQRPLIGVIHLLLLFGVLYTVASVQAQSEINLSVLILDVSGSMSGQDGSGFIKIDVAEQASEIYLSSVIAEQSTKLAAPERVGLLTFADQAILRQAPTSAYNTVIQEVTRLIADGGTNLYGAIVAAEDTLSQAERMAAANGERIGEKRLVLVTDGVPTESSSGTTNRDTADLQAEVLQRAVNLQGYGACIDIISIGDSFAPPDSEDYVDLEFLEDLRDAVGCGAVYNESLTDLARRFINIRLEVTDFEVDVEQEITLIVGQELQALYILPESVPLRVDVIWSLGQIAVQLFSPNGELISVDDPRVSVTEGPYYTQYLLQNPTPGEWTIVLSGRGATSDSIQANLVISRGDSIASENLSVYWVILLIFTVIVVGGFIHLFNRPATNVNYDTHAMLRLETGQKAGLQIPLTAPQMIIGRAQDCNIVLAENRVSRRHTQIVRQDGEYYLYDMNSFIGTTCNEYAIAKNGIRLRNGDSIMIGNTKFTFWDSQS